ncbi:tyrosine-type recombinase/integrase [Euzebya sp.]|uniref:tyrosine-type recombinase/integrase n=1 Tax=Euzebya sp. TaxID=1971409 RepID=UPI0035156390
MRSRSQIEALSRSFSRWLRAANRSERTVETYVSSVAQLVDFAEDRDLDPLARETVTEYLADLADRRKPATVAFRYRSLQQFFKWLEAEEEVEHSPMAKLRPPRVPEQPVPILSPDQQRALLGTCDGKNFVDRRDHAILRLFIDTGMRLGEMTGITLPDVDLDVDKVVWVTGKGNWMRACPFGRRTGMAIDRYLRVRARHQHAQEAALWLGAQGRGPLGSSGINQIVKRRAEQADIPRLHAHMFRHTFADNMRRAGMDDDSLMRLAGWRSRQMLSRYGASAADSRARERYQSMAPGDAL